MSGPRGYRYQVLINQFNWKIASNFVLAKMLTRCEVVHPPRNYLIAHYTHCPGQNKNVTSHQNDHSVSNSSYSYGRLALGWLDIDVSVLAVLMLSIIIRSSRFFSP
jgi:hypothetical protein